MKSGQLYGENHPGDTLEINTSNPKIYYAPGNCLIGDIPIGMFRKCMALGWLHTGGASQYSGYTVTTWYGYAGWGVADYFITLKDRFTYAEAVFLNNQALLYDLDNVTPGTDSTGLAHDRDVYAFYGDPACHARLENTTTADPAYDQELIVTGSGAGLDTLTFRITMNRDGHPGRHPIALFPAKLESPSIISTDANDAVVNDGFALLNVWYSGQPNLSTGETREVVFTVGALASADEVEGGDPVGPRLGRTYPNPFDSATTLQYHLTRPGHASLRVYDVEGRLVAVLVDADMPAGSHSAVWDGSNDNGRRVSAGVYFCRLRAEGMTLTREIVVR
jgi:hypothetical protein